MEVGKEDTSVGKTAGVVLPLSVGVRIDSVSVGIGVVVSSTVGCALAAWATIVCAAAV